EFLGLVELSERAFEDVALELEDSEADDVVAVVALRTQAGAVDLSSSTAVPAASNMDVDSAATVAANEVIADDGEATTDAANDESSQKAPSARDMDVGNAAVATGASEPAPSSGRDDDAPMLASSGAGDADASPRVLASSEERVARRIEQSIWNTKGVAAAAESSHVMSVAVFPDGRRVVSGSNDKTLKVQSVAVFPDGRRVVSGSNDKTLKVWDVDTGECMQTLEGHSNCVRRRGVSSSCVMASLSRVEEAVAVASSARSVVGHERRRLPRRPPRRVRVKEQDAQGVGGHRQRSP
ncbi:hypothetical protein SO694_00196012, partial [Aureococcus anophagefferens]